MVKHQEPMEVDVEGEVETDWALELRSARHSVHMVGGSWITAASKGVLEVAHGSAE